jgi:hypothetical protein
MFCKINFPINELTWLKRIKVDFNYIGPNHAAKTADLIFRNDISFAGNDVQDL